LERGNPNPKSLFLALPTVPRATAFSYPALVVLATFVFHRPRFPIIRKNNDFVFIVYLYLRVHLSFNMLCTDTGSFQFGSQMKGINNQP